LIKQQIPGIRFIIAGSNPPEEIKKLTDESDIILKGYISDEELERLYTTCKMAIIPLRYGAGVKGKTVEAMRYGIPLVTTKFGIEGLPGDFSFLKPTESPVEFAERIVSLYKSEQQLAALSDKSIQYIQNNFSEEVAKNILERILENDYETFQKKADTAVKIYVPK
jgi:glycosyltransferase involved in cell wall biosynthesis